MTTAKAKKESGGRRGARIHGGGQVAADGEAPKMRRGRPSAADFLTVPSDAELVARVAAGHVGAFEDLYRRHSDAAWRVAQAVTGNRDDAADAVAEAFTRVLQVLPAGRLDEGVPFRPYLLAATRNAAIDTLRRAARPQPRAPLHTLDPRRRPRPPPPDGGFPDAHSGRARPPALTDPCS